MSRKRREISSTDEGVQLLWAEVIRRALDDLRAGSEDALEFFRGEGLDFACSWLDLDPKWFRQQLAQEGIIDLAA